MPISADSPTPGTMSAAISNATVRTLSEYTGRGPTKARTHISDDLITVVLQDTLTKGERTLVRNGELALVLAGRKAYQNAMKLALIASIEEISGRKVLAFLSDNHVGPDYAIESFVLAPRLDGGAAAGEDGRAATPGGEAWAAAAPAAARRGR